MKIRDNKKTRNYRRWRELGRARDKRENLIGMDTGYTDKLNNPILTGDRVILVAENEYCGQIVLFDKGSNRYCVFRGCWYREKNPFDPRSYGKIDYTFPHKETKLDNIVRFETT